jgi:inner membrane protein YidH
MSEEATAPPGGEVDPNLRMAAERTLLAWVRTGVSMMGFGFVVAKFGLFLREMAAMGQGRPHSNPAWSVAIGTALVLMGVVVNLLAAWEHTALLRELAGGRPRRARHWSLSLVVALGLAVVGLGMMAYLVFVA